MFVISFLCLLTIIVNNSDSFVDIPCINMIQFYDEIGCKPTNKSIGIRNMYLSRSVLSFI